MVQALNRSSLKTHTILSLFLIFDCIEKYINIPTDLGHCKTSTTSKIHSSALKPDFPHTAGQWLLLWEQREKQQYVNPFLQSDHNY